MISAYSYIYKNVNRTAGSGNLMALQWLRSEGCEWDVDTCHIAALNGHLHVLRWLKEECEDGQQIWCEKVFSFAARGGHLHILKWADDMGFECRYPEIGKCAGGLLLMKFDCASSSY